MADYFLTICDVTNRNVRIEHLTIEQSTIATRHRRDTPGGGFWVPLCERVLLCPYALWGQVPGAPGT